MNSNRNSQLLTPDRRVRRTKECLRTALLDLILEKPYDRITVQDILDRADVSRSTFYAHFLDKDDLLLMGMPENILHYGSDESERLIPSVAGLFEHVQSGQSWYDAMLPNEAMTMISRLARQRMVENWCERIDMRRRLGDTFDLPADALAHYLTGALLSLLQWWIAGDMAQTPHEMDRLFQQIVSGKYLETAANKEAAATDA